MLVELVCALVLLGGGAPLAMAPGDVARQSAREHARYGRIVNALRIKGE